VLILQVSLRDRLRDEYTELVEHLRVTGCSVEARAVADREEAWWFADGRGGAAEARAGTRTLVNATVDWFVDQLRRGQPA
jgi:hypothetical protein